MNKNCLYLRLLLIAGASFLSTSLMGVSVPSAFVAFDTNDNIVIAKSSFNANNNVFAVARFTPEGVLDPTFGAAAVAAASATSLGDGTSNTAFNGAVFPVAGIVTTDVSQATTFNLSETNQNDNVANSVVVDDLDRITAAGSVVINGISNFALVRYLPTGALDTTFIGNSALETPGIVITSLNNADSVIRGMIIDVNGNVVVTGFTTTTTGLLAIAVARYNDDGTLDNTFDNGGLLPGVVTTAFPGGSVTADAITQDATDRLVVAGTAFGTNFVVARYTPAGALDTTFNPTGAGSGIPGVVITALPLGPISGHSVIVDNDTSIVVTGTLTNIQTTDQAFVTIRYNDDGTLDTTFNPTGAVSGVPGIVVTDIGLMGNLFDGIAIDENDNIIVSGYNQQLVEANVTISTFIEIIVIRYTPDGALDTTFNPAGAMPGIVTTNISAELATSLGLGFNAASQGISPTQVGLTVNAPVDTTSAVIIDVDGSIVTANFSNNGQTNNDLAIGRYLPTGELDTTFDAAGLIPGVAFTNLFFNSIFFRVSRGPSPVYIDSPIVGPSPLEVLPEVPGVQGILASPAVFFPTQGSIVRDSMPLILGKALPASAVTIFINNVPMGSVVADIEGNWSYRTIELGDDTYELSTRAIDVLGAISQPSEPITFSIVTYTPEPPVIMLPQPHLVFINNQVPIEGTSAPGDFVNIYINNKLVDRVITSPLGGWSFETKLPDGSYTVFARAKTTTGNTSARSLPVPFTVNSELAQPPKILSPRAHEIIKTPRITIDGIAGKDAVVTLFLNNEPLAKFKANNKGAWSYTSDPLADGAYTFSAAILDRNLQIIASSESVQVVVNTRPLVSAPTPAVAASRPPAPPMMITDASFTVNGKADPHSVITLSIDGKPFNQVTASEDGAWSDTVIRGPNLASGIHTISAFTINPDKSMHLLSRLSVIFG